MSENDHDAWQLLERRMRRVVRLRELNAPREILDNEVAMAREAWARVPPAAGGRYAWPADLEPLARELGFEPDTRASA
jgi:hypothetical protein